MAADAVFALPPRLLLVGLAVVAMAGAADRPGSFSHRLHLKLKPDCTACHVSVASSSRAADNNLPSREACRPCHQQAGIRQPRETTVSKFNHQLHLKFGNVAPLIAKAIDSGAYLSPAGDLLELLNTRNQCAGCHHGIEKSEAAGMDVFPRMADCLVCHNKIDNPFTCSKCHQPGPHLKPVNHTGDFLDTHTTGKLNLDKTTCAVCHGRQFTCLGCH